MNEKRDLIRKETGGLASDHSGSFEPRLQGNMLKDEERSFAPLRMTPSASGLAQEFEAREGTLQRSEYVANAMNEP